MLPGRLGVRFALEALFLILLAIGAGLADLRPSLILLVMAVAWVLVAVIEFTAERIAASPVSYLLPTRGEAPVESDPVSWPMVEERTVVAPPERPAEPQPEERASEPSVDDAEIEPAPSRRAFGLRRRARPDEPEAEAEAEAPSAEDPAEEAEDEEGATASHPRLALGGRFGRRRRDEEPKAPTPPRHVKLLPRRSAPAPSRATEEVAELFGSEDGSREDSAG